MKKSKSISKTPITETIPDDFHDKAWLNDLNRATRNTRDLPAEQLELIILMLENVKAHTPDGEPYRIFSFEDKNKKKTTIYESKIAVLNSVLIGIEMNNSHRINYFRTADGSPRAHLMSGNFYKLYRLVYGMW